MQPPFVMPAFSFALQYILSAPRLLIGLSGNDPGKSQKRGLHFLQYVRSSVTKRFDNIV
jgi:hypothetical protein